MLSYQHLYHAGNLADVHKHSLLAWMLDYLTLKDKPLSYLETHAGRALYDLATAEALKTGEATQGITQVLATHWFAKTHPYRQILKQIRDTHGPQSYPGSPMLAAEILRPTDRLHLAELHPQEYSALDFAMSPYNAQCYAKDGYAMAQSLCPPTPRRGLMLIDPSYELKSDYQTLPVFLRQITRKWPVGVIILWYPLLISAAHRPMLAELEHSYREALRHEVRFLPARSRHKMIGSGILVINPPFGLSDETMRLSRCFKKDTLPRPEGIT